MKTVGDKLIVQDIEILTPPGGLEMPVDVFVHRSAQVVAVGPEVTNVAPGDTVIRMTGPTSAVKITVDGKEYSVLSEKYVLAVL